MKKTLASIYLDASQPASFGGLYAVYRAVKEKAKNKISRKQVRDWSSQQDVFTPVSYTHLTLPTIYSV